MVEFLYDDNDEMCDTSVVAGQHGIILFVFPDNTSLIRPIARPGLEPKKPIVLRNNRVVNIPLPEWVTKAKEKAKAKAHRES